MALRGRKKKTDAQKIAEGTFRLDRQQPTMDDEQIAEIGAPPAWLPRSGQEVWIELAPSLAGYIPRTSLTTLERYCWAEGQFRDAVREGRHAEISPAFLTQIRSLACDLQLPACEAGRRPKKVTKNKRADDWRRFKREIKGE